MKKCLSALIAAVLILGLLSGCSPADAELYAAILRSSEAENVKETQTLTWNVDITEPVTVEADEAYYGSWYAKEIEESQNTSLNVLKKLAEDFVIEAVTVKNGSRAKTDLKLSKPDLRISFTAWEEATDDSAKVICKVPTFVSPFIYKAAGDRKYIVIDTANAEAPGTDAAALAEYTQNVQKLSELIIEKLSFPLVSAADVTAEGSVYTVKFDEKALKGLADDVISILSGDEAAEIMVDIISYFANQSAAIYGEDALSREEIAKEYSDAMKNAGLYCAAISQQIESSGLLKNGLTVKYTVGADGLLIRSDAEMVLDIDLEALNKAFREIMGIIMGTGTDSFDTGIVTKGKYTVTVGCSATYDYVTEAVDFPEITEENSIDFYTELSEYQEYQAAKAEWDDSWNWYYYPEEYGLSEGEAFTVKTLETGAEASFTAAIMEDEYGDDCIYVPLNELCALFDGFSVSWNSVTMGVEVRYPSTDYYDEIKEVCIYIPNSNGLELLDEYECNSYFDYETYNYVYTGDILSAEVIEAYENYYSEIISAHFDENGKAYVDLGDFLSDIGYLMHLDGNTVELMNYDSWLNTYRNFDEQFEGIEDNFLYILLDMLNI